MITLSEILNRSIVRNGGKPVADDDIQTECEWCVKALSLGQCRVEKEAVGLTYRCPRCSDVLVLIRRSAPPNYITKEPLRGKERVEDGHAEEASDEPTFRGTYIDGWRIASTEDLIVQEHAIFRVQLGALRKFW